MGVDGLFLACCLILDSQRGGATCRVDVGVNCRTVKAVEIGLMAYKYGAGSARCLVCVYYGGSGFCASAEALGGGLYDRLFDGRLLWSGGGALKRAWSGR